MSLVLRYAARSDRGLVRANNEDSVYAGPRLLAVADGMGGHVGGEVASQLVMSAVVPLDADTPGRDLLGQLSDAVRAGNDAIISLVQAEPELAGMGTTLTAVLFAGSRLGLVHVGDSRAYLMREGVLTQITHDDTFVQSLVDEGRLTAEEAANHPQRALVLQALNGDDVTPWLTVRECYAGDRYLLCSDGLSDVVSSDTLTDALRIDDPQAGADRLIELALRSGGPDNITVVVADVVELEYGEDYPILGGAVSGQDDDGQVPDTAAGRAAAVNPARAAPRRVPATTAPAPQRRRRTPILLAGVAVLGVVLAALAGQAWLHSNYYVGEDDGAVSVLQGVPGSILGYSLQKVALQGCLNDDGTVTLQTPAQMTAGCDVLQVDDLQPAERGLIRNGLPGGSDAQARGQVQRLSRQSLLPLCTLTPPATTPPFSTPPVTTPPPTSAAPMTIPPLTKPPVPPAVGAPVTPTPPVAVTSSPVPTPTGTDLALPAQEPGSNCRAAR